MIYNKKKEWKTKKKKINKGRLRYKNIFFICWIAPIVLRNSSNFADIWVWYFLICIRLTCCLVVHCVIFFLTISEAHCKHFGGCIHWSGLLLVDALPLTLPLVEEEALLQTRHGATRRRQRIRWECMIWCGWSSFNWTCSTRDWSIFS